MGLKTAIVVQVIIRTVSSRIRVLLREYAASAFDPINEIQSTGQSAPARNSAAIPAKAYTASFELVGFIQIPPE